MELFSNIFKTIPLKGLVDIQIYHPEDIARKEPIHTENGDNTVNSYLFNKLAEMLRTNSSSNTSHHLTHWANATSYSENYPSYAGGHRANYDNTQNSIIGAGNSQVFGGDGIFVNTHNRATGGKSSGTGASDVASTTQALCLTYKPGGGTTGTSVSSNVFTIVGEAKWQGEFTAFQGALGSNTSASMRDFKLGTNFVCASGTGSTFGSGDATLWCTYQSSYFTLDINDILKVTWTITIG